MNDRLILSRRTLLGAGLVGAIGIVAVGPLLVVSYYMQRSLIRSFSVELGGR